MLLFAQIGAFAFGGGIGIVAYMEREVVHKRRIVSVTEFLNGIAMSQTLGPMVVNASFFIGYRLYGFWGGLLCLFAFTVPSVVLVIFLAWLYFAHHALPALQGILAGVQPAVIALITSAGWSLGKRAVRTVPAVILCAAGLASGVMQVGFIYALIGSGLVGMLLGSRRILGDPKPTTEAQRTQMENNNNEDSKPIPAEGTTPTTETQRTQRKNDYDKDSKPTAESPNSQSESSNKGGIFGVLGFSSVNRFGLPLTLAATAGAATLLKMSLVSLKVGVLWVGGTFTIVALLYQNLVVEQGWITPAIFRDAVAIAGITPGPLSVLATFTGYYLHGVTGSLVATYSLYIPSICIMSFLCRRYDRLKPGGRSRDFLNGLSPCVVGVVLSAAVMLSHGVLATGLVIHYRACVLTLVSFVLLVRLKWAPGYVLALAAAVGWMVRMS